MYVTVGTGVGVGLVINSKTVHGLVHPEGGHLKLPRRPQDINGAFDCSCSFHGDCVEGICASGALAAFKVGPGVQAMKPRRGAYPYSTLTLISQP
mmetsp:Transcript_37577/g.117443  ORF Transcript_37577/g.117443 Transcript_37577/m.117443 type:complete len:95 (+) Transcript_37577:681-965(+)